MPQTCTICAHEQRTAIERALARTEPLRAIAGQFGVSRGALSRHRDKCGRIAIHSEHQAQDAVRSRSVRDELERVFVRISKLFDACDRWLADPDRPGEYDLCPRAEEVDVVYIDGESIRKAKLSVLLRRLQTETGLIPSSGEWKVADPRDLVLKTAAQLTRQIELLAKLTGELDERPQVNILVHPDWLQLRDTILDILTRHPAALDEVSDALSQHSS